MTQTELLHSCTNTDARWRRRSPVSAIHPDPSALAEGNKPPRLRHDVADHRPQDRLSGSIPGADPKTA